MKNRILLLASLAGFVCPVLHAAKFDVVVYGGTAGGVIAAVGAAREGLKVALLEPGRHLGGMVSAALSWTDFGSKGIIRRYPPEIHWCAGRPFALSRPGPGIAPT